MKKRISMILLLLVLCFSMAVSAFATDGAEGTDGFVDEYYRMQDLAGVLTEEEAGEVQNLLDEMSVNLKFDMVIVISSGRVIISGRSLRLRIRSHFVYIFSEA